jgi:hypothetical protein
MNDLNKEKYKPLKKETEKENRRWEDLPCSWIGRINIVKWLYYQKQLFNAIPINSNDIHHRD